MELTALKFTTSLAGSMKGQQPRIPPSAAIAPDDKIASPDVPTAGSAVRAIYLDTCFKDYRFENVYLKTTRSQRDEIIGFWRDQEAVCDGREAKRRSHEAVFLVRTTDGELAGLSTVGFMRLEDGRIFYAYRMFLRPRDRVPYLMVGVILATRDFLGTFAHPKLQPAGLLHVNENDKLMRPGIRKLFARHGYEYWGQTPGGEDVWGVAFRHLTQNPHPLTPWQRFRHQLTGWCTPPVPILHFRPLSDESLNQHNNQPKEQYE